MVLRHSGEHLKEDVEEPLGLLERKLLVELLTKPAA
jgi:hypothetical protein